MICPKCQGLELQVRALKQTIRRMLFDAQGYQTVLDKVSFKDAEELMGEEYAKWFPESSRADKA